MFIIIDGQSINTENIKAVKERDSQVVIEFLGGKHRLLDETFANTNASLSSNAPHLVFVSIVESGRQHNLCLNSMKRFYVHENDPLTTVVEFSDESYVGISVDIDYMRTLSNSITNPGSETVSLLWQGAYPEPPLNPEEGWVYRDTDDGNNYIYSNGSWDIFIPKPADGVSPPEKYTWIKYADDETGTNLSDFPEGKTHIGLAYNKTEATESLDPADYSWAQIKGDVGDSTYTWIKYADDALGTNFSDDPTNRDFIGIAYNKVLPESEDPDALDYQNYQWSEFRGPQGVAGDYLETNSSAGAFFVRAAGQDGTNPSDWTNSAATTITATISETSTNDITWSSVGLDTELSGTGTSRDLYAISSAGSPYITGEQAIITITSGGVSKDIVIRKTDAVNGTNISDSGIYTGTLTTEQIIVGAGWDDLPATGADNTLTAIETGFTADSGGIQLGTAASIHSANLLDTFPDDGDAGIWLGTEGGVGKFYVGTDINNYLKYNGTSIEFKGSMTAGSITGTSFATETGLGGQRIILDSSTNELLVYGDRGDGGVEKLITIGLNGISGTDYRIIDVGNFNADLMGLMIRATTQMNASEILNNGLGSCLYLGRGTTQFVTSLNPCLLARYVHDNNGMLATGIYAEMYSAGTSAASTAITAMNVADQAGGRAILANSYSDSGKAVQAVCTAGIGGVGVYSSGSGNDFYAAGTGTYAPFTGSHEGLILNTESVSVGDILLDAGVIYRKNISGTLCQNTISTNIEQKAVVGVLCGSAEFDISILDGVTINSLSDFMQYYSQIDMPEVMFYDIFENVTNENYLDIKSYADNILTTMKLATFNSVGEGQISVVPEGGNIEIGDYICTSSSNGKGMKQGDDLLHNYTVAKSRENVIWEEGDTEPRIIACTYHCG